MIYNQKTSGLRALHVDMPDALDEMLRHHRFNFYLTGSRAFHQERPDSDWDFFVRNEDEAVEFLVRLGFEEEYDNPYHGDVNAVRVYRLDSWPKIHVQFVTRLDIKIRAQDYILKHFGAKFFYTLSKEQRKRVWQMVQIILRESDNE